MTFTWPAALWGLALLPVALWGLGLAGRRRPAQARLADPHLFTHLAGGPDPRRRWPSVLYALAATCLIVGAARPVATVPVPTNRAALVIAIDTSQSMMADDVKPSRLGAARAGARVLARALPRNVRIGLVAFSDAGTILVLPTTDRHLLEEALDRLRPQQSTAIGSAVIEGLAILPGRRELLGERLARLRTQSAPDPLAQSPPSGSTPPPGPADLPPGAIVIFSDGVTNTGIAPQLSAALAAEARVRVHAVGVGQQGGAIMPYNGSLVFVPFEASSLQDLAGRTGGEYFAAVNEDGIRRIARHLGRAIGWERQRTEITAILAGAAACLMLAGALLSGAWFRRIP
ncbi:MAG: VWA domain-containing protein [Armatimonadota bacterium]|nr:VWA domain-containing protein [Armatimonadota bacterium]